MKKLAVSLAKKQSVDHFGFNIIQVAQDSLIQGQYDRATWTDEKERSLTISSVDNSDHNQDLEDKAEQMGKNRLASAYQLNIFASHKPLVFVQLSKSAARGPKQENEREREISKILKPQSSVLIEDLSQRYLLLFPFPFCRFGLSLKTDVRTRKHAHWSF